MVRRLADVKEVGDHATHEVAGVVAVEVREAEALVLVKEILAHAALHARAHDVTPVANEVAARVAHGIHDHEASRDDPELGENRRRALGEEPTRKRSQDDGKRQVDGRHHEGSHRVDGKQVPLGVVVREKHTIEVAVLVRLGRAAGIAGH